LSIWFFLWFIFAVLMIAVTGWSTYILIQQKQAWKKFAASKKIAFQENKFFAPAEMSGTIDEFTVSFFTGEQQNPEARKNRQLTVFEIVDPTPYVDGLACGNGQMKAFINLLDALTPHIVKDDNWQNSYTISSRNKDVVDVFLTPQRLKIMSEMIGFPKSDVIIILDGEQGVFRFETSNPLTDADKIDEMLQKLFSRIKKLRPSADELKKLQLAPQKEVVKPIKAETEKIEDEKLLAETSSDEVDKKE